MAETVKMLSPEKQVYLANPVAGCPMAEQIEPEMLAALKAENPDHTVVAYINTTAELKTLCDVAVTSSSAVKIINNIDNDKILFVPDCNLGDWIGKKLPNKQMKLVHGGCPTHLRFTQRDFDKAREEHPGAKILIHPESRPEFVAQADFVGSTTEIMAYAKKSEDKEFIIATENSIVEHLQFDCPDKNFYALSKDCVCHNMQATTLADVYRTVLGTGGEEILMSDELIRDSRKCIDAMLELGK